MLLSLGASLLRGTTTTFKGADNSSQRLTSANAPGFCSAEAPSPSYSMPRLTDTSPHYEALQRCRRPQRLIVVISRPIPTDGGQVSSDQSLTRSYRSSVIWLTPLVGSCCTSANKRSCSGIWLTGSVESLRLTSRLAQHLHPP